MTRFKNRQLTRKTKRLHKKGMKNLLELFDTLNYIKDIPLY